MAVESKVSLALSAVLAITVLAASQLFKVQLAETKSLTIVAGILSSLFFMLALTAIGNLESVMFGKGYEIQLIPEVAFSLLVALGLAASIHRVSITVCFISSLVILYFMNSISQQKYAIPEAPQTKVEKKKRK